MELFRVMTSFIEGMGGHQEEKSAYDTNYGFEEATILFMLLSQSGALYMEGGKFSATMTSVKVSL